MPGKTTYISYADWAALVAKTRADGVGSEAFAALKNAYPQTAGEAYVPMVQKELARLETCLLKRAFDRFQKEINLCLEEADIEGAEAAIRNLKKNLRACLFYNGILEYPQTIRESMNAEIRKNVRAFWQEYLRFLRKLSYTDGSAFVEELLYRCRKCNVDQVILECENNVQLCRG